MFRYVAITLLIVLVRQCACAPSPLRVTIDCSGSDERSSFGGSPRASSELFSNRRFDVNSFCNLIHSAIPKAVQDGKFILLDPDVDQIGYSDTQVPISVAPPEGFIPKLALTKWKRPKLKVPTMKVPRLRPQSDMLSLPRLGSISLPILGDPEEESSAEKMEKIKKGIQKLLHVVKVLGQVDQYLSERTRIVVDKISKTLAE
ncbi:hypothetical protein O3G_MSEX012615 [Manduca sexta]|uniref:Uncharacterized protein n=1 Tax=Manduca sexta TaxID=7130 RepID=A0A921ZQ61_MANSE|nr:hypothetical protein O3G_MSEX012615 [Manduca sexta]